VSGRIGTQIVHGNWSLYANYLLSWRRIDYAPYGECSDVGFRVAGFVPESGSTTLLVVGAISLLAYA
jgi:hypothetical protein